MRVGGINHFLKLRDVIYGRPQFRNIYFLVRNAYHLKRPNFDRTNTASIDEGQQ